MSSSFRMKFSLNQEKIIAFTQWEESVFYRYWIVSWETLVYMCVMPGMPQHPVQWISMVRIESLLDYHYIYLQIRPIYFPDYLNNVLFIYIYYIIYNKYTQYTLIYCVNKNFYFGCDELFDSTLKLNLLISLLKYFSLSTTLPSTGTEVNLTNWETFTLALF